MLIEAILAVDFHALEIPAQNEVDDTRDGIRSVHGRGAARDHVDALDHCGWNLIQISRRIRVERVRIAVTEALAVNEYQGALGTQTAQVNGRDAAG